MSDDTKWHQDDRDVQDNQTPGFLLDTTRRDFLRAAGVGVGAGALALGTSTPVEAAIVEETCGNGDTIDVGGGNWRLLNNKWGSPDADQCIWRHDDGGYGWDFTSNGENINFPESFCGGRPWGSDTGIPELPGRRGDIWEFQLEWDTALTMSTGEWNFTEEWWLLDGQPQSSNPPIEYEVMLVLDWGSDLAHPMVQENVRTDQFGNQIDHWADYDHSEGWKFEIFRIAGGATSGQVDFMEIIDYMNSYFGGLDDLTLTGVEVGTEYWGGSISGDATHSTLDLTVNGTTYESGTTDSSSGGGGPISTGTYRISNVNSGLFLEVASAGTSDGDNVQQWSDTGHPCQEWYVEEVSGGVYRLENVNSGKVLDVEGVSTSDGANLHQWEDLGGDNQRWNIWEDGSGEYVLEAVHSGKVADVEGFSTSDGGNVVQWSDGGTANQRWYFDSV